MIYLASPYSDPSALIRKHRYHQVSELYALLLTLDDAPIYCPIVASHHIALEQKLPTSAAFWWNMNRGILRHASAFWLATLDGWKQSAGVAQELEFAQACGIPVYHVNDRGELS